MTEWSSAFEEVVREYVPSLGDDELVPDLNLYELGLDSMGTVGLLVAVEDLLDVEFPDRFLVPETFRTAGNLWAVALSVGAAERDGS